MMFGLTILGNNSAVPAFNRNPTSQVLTYDGNNYLIDCGEGTQIQLMRYKIRRSKISHIFISHLHGDHYFGLIGLINSFGLLNRQQELHIYGPAALKKVIDIQLEISDTTIPFPLHFHEINQAAILVDTEKIRISCFPTNHRIPCFGFSFEEKKIPRKAVPENSNRENTPGRKYAYCADTKYDEALVDIVKDFDLVYHESTYLHDQELKASERYHSTTKQAATIALKANVKKLIIGHFSSKYSNLNDFEIEAKEVFPNTSLAIEGTTYLV